LLFFFLRFQIYLGEKAMTDKRIDAVLKIQERHIETLLQFHTVIVAIRLEVDALKALLLADDSLKAEFARQIGIAATNAAPALQQLRVAAQKQLAEVRALQIIAPKLAD
jgi:hypothetical protein